MKYLVAFLSGAIAGAAASILLAPEKGEDLRAQIRNIVRRYGCHRKEEIDQLVDEIAAEIQAGK